MQCRSVVIIEDEQTIRETLKMFLELEGYEVFTAENGRIGLELISAIPKAGVILLDLMMPVMNGWEFMEKLSQDGRLASIPVVVVTAYADRSHGIRVRDIVSKPVDLDALLNLVKRYCGEGRKDDSGAA